MSVVTRARFMGRSVATRKVVTYRRDNFTGFVPSRKNGRVIQYESLLERDYIQLLEADPGVVAYSEQPTPLKWSDGVSSYETTFDFCVVSNLSGKYLSEVKPLSKVIKHRLHVQYGYAREAAKEQGYDDLELWTEREIRAFPRLSSAELVVSGETSFEAMDAQLALLSAIGSIRRLSDCATIRELRAASNLGAVAYWEIIRMVARGQLIPVDKAALLDDRAVLRFASSESSNVNGETIQ
ncbi:hypothetical protein GPL17_19100 [Bradyrhizobium yuanmingense]|uniref:hypothetical protein n=1 Tax=Bradyrhizobium yuanmingense TaxID=108015 RepID=UPI0012F881B4|nr:hypothetical protein [Bradyrhizobium yuanmingense]MVT52592.1 hypothetical protein [Bradyrhizobium yuanmingense]